MSDLCFHVVQAARARYAPPDERAGQYVGAIIRAHDMTRYYRRMAGLAREPRTAATAASFWAIFDTDAQFIVRAGLFQLLERDELATFARAEAEAVLQLELWAVSDGS